jgi:hypothetical protein
MATIRDGITRYRKAYLQLNRAVTKYFDIINISESDIKIKSICCWQEVMEASRGIVLQEAGKKAAT